MDLLTRQTIIINMDKNGEQYSMEFVGCRFLDVYRTLKTIVMNFESGEIFENELRIADESGEPVSITSVRALIDAAKEEIESGGTGSFG